MTGISTHSDQSSLDYGVPFFEGQTKTSVARIAAYIHVEYGEELFCRADVMNALSASPAEVSRVCRRLIEQGFLTEHTRIPDAQRANRPVVPVQATSKLTEYMANVPFWREKALFFRIQKHLGCSEDEAMSYLVNIGARTLGILDN